MSTIKGKAFIGSLALLAMAAAGQQALAQSNPDLAALLPESIKSKGVVTVATPMDVPPNIWLEDGNLRGEAVDLARAMEPILGVTFDFQDIQWPGVIPGIQSGNYDMSIGVMSYRPEREEVMDMIVFRSNVSGILTLAENAGKITSPADLCGQPVAAVQGAVLFQQLEKESEACVAAGKPAINVQTYPKTGLAVVALKAGSVIAYPASTGEMAYVSSTSNGELISVHFNEWAGNPQAIAVSKELPGLADALAGALQELNENGTYLEILTRYGLEASAIAKDEIKVNPGANP